MKIKVSILIVALLCGVLQTSSLLGRQSADSLRREILFLQDQRTLGEGRLVALMGNAREDIRKSAAIAVANIQDTSVRNDVERLLKDAHPQVRRAAAFALGQLNSPNSCGPLLNALSHERDQQVIGEVIEALGKVGQQSELDSLVSLAESRKFAGLPVDIATGIARFGIRGIKGERAIWWCFNVLKDRSAEVRWRALYALWRMAPHSLFDGEVARRKELLSGLTSDPVADVRFNLAVVLGRVEGEDARELLTILQKNEEVSRKSNWRVDVSIARALATHGRKGPRAASEFLKMFRRKDIHVLSAVCQSLHTGGALVGSDDFRDSLRAELKSIVFNDQLPVSLRGDASIALVRVSPGEAKGMREYLRTQMGAHRLAGRLLEAISHAPDRESYNVTKSMLSNPDIGLAMVAWDVLRRFVRIPAVSAIAEEQGGRATLGRGLFLEVCAALQRSDMGVTTVVSSLLSDSSFSALLDSAGVKADVVDSLSAAFGKLKSPADVEAQQAAAAALGSLRDVRAIPVLERALADPDRTVGLAAADALKELTGTDHTWRVEAASKISYSDYDWNMLSELGPKPRMVIRTPKGTIVMELLPNEAPFTVMSFVRLVRKKFYDGLTFHRVVPNFVVQGGDPRGDGWGGPDYSIRTEVSLVGYERGSVGVASAGKDTEGCQFFITHGPTLHLDGRYTIFARVVNGMDVADKLCVGDKINTVTVQAQGVR